MSKWLRNILIIAAIVMAWTVVLVAMLTHQRSSVHTSEEWVQHTQNVLQTTKTLDADIQRLIAHQRGYIITRDHTFLDIYALEKSNILGHIITVASITQDNERQTERIKALQADFLLLTGLLEERIQNLTPKSVMPWQLKDTENLKGIDQRIQSSIADILDEESKLLNDRLKHERSQKDRYQLLINSGIAITILLVVALNIIILRLNYSRRSAEAESRDMQDRFALAMKSTADGVFDWDLEHNTVYYSPRFKQMLGLRDEEMENTLEAFNALVHPDDLQSMWAYANYYLSGQLSEYSTIFRMKHNNGGWIWIHCRARGIFNHSGKAIRLTGAHTDITPMKEIEEKLKMEKELAEQASRAKSEFLANMSHEIRTPLNAIIGVSNILTRVRNLPESKRDELISTLQHSSTSLLDLINDVLDFAKIENGDLSIEHLPFELPKVFDQVVAIMALKAAEKKIEFSLDHSRLLFSQHHGDAVRFRQILINLVGNAIKFTERGSVHVSARHEQGQLIVDVRDTGIGIGKEQLQTIFNKFEQADNSITRRFGGTGLGLAISQQLANLMGGQITVESLPESGSTFTLSLPASEAAPLQVENVAAPHKTDNVVSLTPGSAKPAVARKKSSKKNRILIAEDYSGNIIVIKFLLDNLGIHYDIAHDGAEAVEMYKKHSYPLILMDVQMPHMDGFEATRAIREYEAGAGAKPCIIIAMTAHAVAGDSQRCLKAGMDDYLSKPLMEADIKEKFDRYLPQAA